MKEEQFNLGYQTHRYTDKKIITVPLTDNDVLRIADESAQFGCLERRFSVPLVDGGTIRLPQIIGLGRALELILTGRLIDAEEAKLFGLVNEIVAPGKAIERAVEIAKQLAEFPQVAMLNDRRSVYEGLGLSLEEALKNEAQIGRETWASGEGLRGAKAFSDGKVRSASATSAACLVLSGIAHR